jgi:sugar phosphate isomerase/epimerase
MQISAEAHLTYCLNVHPGETWAEQRQAVATHAAAVKAAVAPGRPFGLGLRLGGAAAAELAAPAGTAELRRLLAEQEMYLFTINGFPCGAFHGGTVKEKVYHPDWRRPERLAYTLRLAGLLAGELPEGLDGSINTVPVSYRQWAPTAAARLPAVEQLAACAAALHDLRRRTGREIHLGLEPEPGCVLETAVDAADFFGRELLPAGGAWLRRRRGMDAREAEEVLRRHIGVCLDVCHICVQFESPEESVALLAGHGIRLSKVHLSAALRTWTTASSARRLEAFADPVYLHQVRVRRPDGTLAAASDLSPALLARWDTTAPPRECRIHFHVPLYLEEHEGLRSTAAELTPSFLRRAVAAGTRHFEIETYTFDVLPPALRRRPVAESIAAEFRWVLRRWADAAGG